MSHKTQFNKIKDKILNPAKYESAERKEDLKKFEPVGKFLEYFFKQVKMKKGYHFNWDPKEGFGRIVSGGICLAPKTIFIKNGIFYIDGIYGTCFPKMAIENFIMEHKYDFEF